MKKNCISATHSVGTQIISMARGCCCCRCYCRRRSFTVFGFGSFWVLFALLIMTQSLLFVALCLCMSCTSMCLLFIFCALFLLLLFITSIPKLWASFFLVLFCYSFIFVGLVSIFVWAIIYCGSLHTRSILFPIELVFRLVVSYIAREERLINE